MKTSKKKKRKKENKKTNRTGKELKPVLKTDSSKIVPKKEELRSNQISSKKSVIKKTEEKNRFSEYTGVVTQFLRDARTELKKVKWPTRKELIASTVIVLVLVLVLALYLGIIDFGLIRMLKMIVG